MRVHANGHIMRDFNILRIAAKLQKKEEKISEDLFAGDFDTTKCGETAHNH